MAAGGVVADRAANRSAVGAGGIGAQHETQRGKRAVEHSDGNAGLYGCCAGILVDGQNAVHVFGRVDDEAGPDALSGQRAAAAARQEGHIVAGGGFHGGLHVIR